MAPSKNTKAHKGSRDYPDSEEPKPRKLPKRLRVIPESHERFKHGFPRLSAQIPTQLVAAKNGQHVPSGTGQSVPSSTPSEGALAQDMGPYVADASTEIVPGLHNHFPDGEHVFQPSPNTFPYSNGQDSNAYMPLNHTGWAGHELWNDLPQSAYGRFNYTSNVVYPADVYPAAYYIEGSASSGFSSFTDSHVALTPNEAVQYGYGIPVNRMYVEAMSSISPGSSSESMGYVSGLGYPEFRM